VVANPQHSFVTRALVHARRRAPSSKGRKRVRGPRRAVAATTPSAVDSSRGERDFKKEKEEEEEEEEED